MDEQAEINIAERVQARMNEGIKIDFDSFFNRSWGIFKQVFWQILIGYIIIMVLSSVASNIINPLIMGPTEYDPKEFVNGSQVDWDKLLDFIQKIQSSPRLHLAQFILGVLTVLVSAPLHAGFLRLCREADKGEPYFGNLFMYFKNEHTGKIIGAGLITTLLASLTSFLFSFVPVVGPFINLIFVIVFYFLFLFVLPLIIFGNASLKEAFGLSIKLFLHRIFPIIGFMLLSFLLSLTGFILCCIGVIISLGFIWIGIYLLYKDSVGFPEDEVEKEEPGHWQQPAPPEV